MYNNSQIRQLALARASEFSNMHMTLMGVQGNSDNFRLIHRLYRDLVRSEATSGPVSNGFAVATSGRKRIIDKKKRHLTQDERHALHKPVSDWSESSRGDVCKSACTVEVGDIVAKYSK